MADDIGNSLKRLYTRQIALNIGICSSNREVFEYLKTLDPKLHGYHRHYTFNVQAVNVSRTWYEYSYNAAYFDHQVLNSCQLAGVDYSKLERNRLETLVITYTGRLTTSDRDDQAYLRWNKNFIQLELRYPDKTKPIEDIVSMLIRADQQHKINGDSMMELIRLGLPLERAEVLHPGMVSKYKVDLETILL